LNKNRKKTGTGISQISEDLLEETGELTKRENDGC